MSQWQIIDILDKIPDSLTVVENKKDGTDPEPTFKILDIHIIRQLFGVQNIATHHNIFIKSNVDNKYFVLQRYSRDQWIQWEVIDTKDTMESYATEESAILQKLAGSDHIYSKVIDYLGVSKPRKLFKLWQENRHDKHEHSNIKPLSLNMQPPNSSSVNTSSKITDNRYKDPKLYISTRYYECLFKIHVQLAYFVKSNMSRFKNMCNTTYRTDAKNTYTSILDSLCIDIPTFDKRYDLKHFTSNGSFNDEFAIKLRDDRINKLVNKDTEINDFITIVKAREIKIQIIFLLELIYSDNMDNNFIDFDTRYKENLKKRSLNISRIEMSNFRIRKKKKKKKLLEEKDIDSKDNIESHNNVSKLDYCEKLDIYIDKLNILDILLSTINTNYSELDNDTNNQLEEDKANLMNKNKETSSVGFIKYVIIPHYARRIPNTIKYIIKKLKGPNMKTKKPIEKKRVISLSQDSIPEKLTSRNLSQQSDIVSSKSSSFKSQVFIAPKLSRQLTESILPDSLTIEKLRSKNNSVLNEFFDKGSNTERNSILQRTKSDMTMTLLQKRQLSVTGSSNKNKNEGARQQDGSEVNSNLSRQKIFSFKSPTAHQPSFRRVGKKKIDPSQELFLNGSTPSKCVGEGQIEVFATPAYPVDSSSAKKRTRMDHIVESPMDGEVTDDDNENSNKQNKKTSPSKPKKKVRRRLFAP